MSLDQKTDRQVLEMILRAVCRHPWQHLEDRPDHNDKMRPWLICSDCGAWVRPYR